MRTTRTQPSPRPSRPAALADDEYNFFAYPGLSCFLAVTERWRVDGSPESPIVLAAAAKGKSRSFWAAAHTWLLDLFTASPMPEVEPRRVDGIGDHACILYETVLDNTRYCVSFFDGWQIFTWLALHKSLWTKL